jgi:hypothetical protein
MIERFWRCPALAEIEAAMNAKFPYWPSLN